MALVNIWVTNFCNMNCRYCYEKEKENIFLSKQLVIPVIEFIKKIQNQNEDVININFHGGEPLLNFEVIRCIVDRVRNENMFANFSFTTNMMLMNGDIAQYILKNDIYLSVSLDGGQEINDSNRVDTNCCGTYQNVTKKLQFLKIYNIPFRTRMTVTPSNSAFLYDSVLNLVNIGCDEIVAVPDLFDKNWNEKSIEKLNIQLDLIDIFMKENLNVNFTFYSDRLRKIGKCKGGITEFNIDCKGRIFPCTFVVGDSTYLIGDIFNGIDNHKLEELKKIYEMSNYSCANCLNQNFCMASRCKYLNKLLEGDYFKASSVICAIENIMCKRLIS